MTMSARGNNLDHVRRHNLATVLRLVHHDRGSARSQLTRATGLNRSTIAALVAELVELGLVAETEPESTKQVGRPSPVVAPRPDVAVLALNPEVDAVELALVGLGGEILRRERHLQREVPSVDSVVALVAGRLAEWSAAEVPAGGGATVAGIGVAVPGLVRASDGLVRHAPHLGWRDAPLAAELAAATSLPAYSANDASLGALAERLFGAGRGIGELVYMNGGASGIGGGIMAGDRLLGGLDGYAGEFGHLRVGGSDHVDTAGLSGTLESEVRRSRLLELGELGTVDDAELERRVRADGGGLSAEIERQAGYLGVAIGGIVNVLNPELVLLGGFLGILLDAAPDTVRAALAATSLDAPLASVRLERPALGRDILMIGAAELAFEPVLADPAGFERGRGPAVARSASGFGRLA
ncbi:putative NBD/HSP70 family sugar kinase [Agromyces albus]|nr:putative NBD/HSP70 family sugar kinase [Agromyces albus]